MITFKNGLYATDGFALAINLQVNANQFCAVLGPSGAGKSTLLSLIAGFENLQSGSIKLDGIEATQISPSLRPVSMVFQDYNAFGHLDLWTNVALGIAPNLKLDAAQQEAVEKALDNVGIATLARRRPFEISGGELQRVALARILVRNKPILLLDEPFAALDPGLRKDMLQLVLQLQKSHRLTVLMVTHQPEEAKKVADKVIFVNGGQARTAINCDDFFNSGDEDVARYLG